jgi:hypothetical protein
MEGHLEFETQGGAWDLHHGIRPLLTYSSMIWWPRVRYNVSRMENSKLQRLACLAVTGVTKMIPTAAMEVLLWLTPLHVMIEVEAQHGTTKCVPNSGNQNPLTSVTPKFFRYGVWTHPTGGVKQDATEISKPQSFMVTFPDKCELMLGCTDGAQEADTASVLGSTPQYSRLKYIPLILV